MPISTAAVPIFTLQLLNAIAATLGLPDSDAARDVLACYAPRDGWEASQAAKIAALDAVLMNACQRALDPALPHVLAARLHRSVVALERASRMSLSVLQGRQSEPIPALPDIERKYPMQPEDSQSVRPWDPPSVVDSTPQHPIRPEELPSGAVAMAGSADSPQDPLHRENISPDAGDSSAVIAGKHPIHPEEPQSVPPSGHSTQQHPIHPEELFPSTVAMAGSADYRQDPLHPENKPSETPDSSTVRETSGTGTDAWYKDHTNPRGQRARRLFSKGAEARPMARMQEVERKVQQRERRRAPAVGGIVDKTPYTVSRPFAAALRAFAMIERPHTP